MFSDLVLRLKKKISEQTLLTHRGKCFAREVLASFDAPRQMAGNEALPRQELKRWWDLSEKPEQSV